MGAFRPYDACKYNVGVECSSQKHCGKCGWNPKVDKGRKLKLKNACASCVYFKQAREI